MISKISAKVITLLLFILFCVKPPVVFGQSSTDSIYSIIKSEVDNKRSKSIIVGIIDRNGRHIISTGVLSDKDQRVPDGNTEYEIGSITKVFTSLILADMSLKKQLKLTDPLLKFLPQEVKPIDKNVRDITLLNLATHTSGFPRFPDNAESKDLENPYADYTVGQLYDYISRFQPDQAPGSQYQYSNTGYSLLGQVISKVSGKDFETLVKDQICIPLKMNSTVVTLTPDLRSNMATGHTEYGKPVANWDMPALASNGALRSNMNDMLKFAAANLGLVKSNLYPAMELSHLKRVKKGQDDAFVALGWTLFNLGDKQVLWKDGTTAGYRAFIAIDKKNKKGVVILSNSLNQINDIAYHILDPSSAIKPYKYKWALLDTITSTAKLKGADAAIALYHELKATKAAEFTFEEPMLNYAGDELRKANQTGAAIKMYQLNITEYPKSTQAYESLADLYKRTGNIKMAIATYEQLVIVDPKNAHGTWILKKLKK
ncbi:MAG TPA: serine hydrolase [Mucilaginibacter sp.]|nr:serine hydrolase [Mucilaginibacter sp.]